MIESRAERPLRIVFFTERFLPNVDGIVTRLCYTIRHLRALGHSVLVVAPGGASDFEGTPVHGVPGFAFPLYPDLKLAIPRPSVSKTVAAFQPDVVHVVNPALLGVGGFYCSASHRVPLVVSYHTHLPKYLRYYGVAGLEGLMWWGIRIGYNRADLTLCTSRAMQLQLQEKGIERVALWQRGVDTEVFHPRRASHEMRTLLTQGHPEDKLLLYVGRLSIEKEIEQCKPVLKALPGVRLALVGDGPHRRKLEQHFAGTATYFAGCLKGEKLAAAFASADIFFLPSRTETLGLVLLEAMAAGCPVVTTGAGGTSDIVQHGVTGHCYDHAQCEAGLDAVRRVLSDFSYRKRLREQARLDAERWEWAAATCQLETYYRGVITREHGLPKQIQEHSARGASAREICEALQISRATLRRHRRMRASS